MAVASVPASRSTSEPQWALPLAVIEAELARAEGDLDAAHATLGRALTPLTPGQDPRYRWPVMSLAMRIEAERAIRAREEVRTSGLTAGW